MSEDTNGSPWGRTWGWGDYLGVKPVRFVEVCGVGLDKIHGGCGCTPVGVGQNPLTCVRNAVKVVSILGFFYSLYSLPQPAAHSLPHADRSNRMLTQLN